MALLPARHNEPAVIGTHPDSGLSLATAICGTSGSGKTTLAVVLALWGLLKGWGQVLLDPTGSLSSAFLHQVYCLLSEFPKGQDALLWDRIHFVRVGATDYVTAFPIYERQQGQGVWEASEQLLRVIEASHPNLITQSSVTWPRARRVASNAGAVLASLGFQLTELEQLLFNTEKFEKHGLFETAITRCPEVKSAIEYFRTQYMPLSRSEKRARTSTFLDHVYRLYQDPGLRLLFGGKQGLTWEDTLEQKRQTVIIDCSGITDTETRRFSQLWILTSLLEHLKQRGRRPFPVALLIDEFASLAHKAAEGANPLADLLDEFCARYARANQVYFTCCFQSLTQLPQDLQQTILRFGNLFVGRTGTMTEARQWADVLFRSDVYKVKYSHGTNHFVIDHRPEFMPIDQQIELAAQQIVSQPAFSFFARVATGEGSVSQSVDKLTIRQVTQDPQTGAPVFPDETLIHQLKSHLAKRAGIPGETIRAEIDSRLSYGQRTTDGQPAQLPVAGRANVRRMDAGHPQPQPERTPHNPPIHQRNADFPDASREERAHPEPGKPETPQSHPTLTEQEKALLAFLIANPDLPVSGVYKGLGVRPATVTKLRENLTKQGFLVELDVGSTSPTGGSPRG